MPLTEKHHAFLQWLMSRGPQPVEEAHRVFQRLFQVPDGTVERQFNEFLNIYNERLDPFQLEIRPCRNQHNSDGATYYGLVNKLANEQAKLGTRYSYAQITYFKALVEAICQEPSAQLSSMQTLNLRIEQESQEPSASSACKLTLAQRDKALKEFIADKWLLQTDDGTISLGIRSFLELRNVFKNLDVHFCDGCNEAAIKAIRCQNEECPVRLHAYCARLRFQRPEASRTCSACGTEWNCDGLGLQSMMKIQTPPLSRQKGLKRQ